MPCFAEIPTVLEAMEMVLRRQKKRIDKRRIYKQEIPADWVEAFLEAEEAFRYIKGKCMAELMDVDLIDGQICDPFDDALEYVCIGDGTYLGPILENVPHANRIQETLNALDELELD